MLRIVLNGQARDTASGTVLGALQEAGAHVPQLCHDERLAPVGACRLCLVEIEGGARPVAACTTPVAEGMVIRTHTPALEGERRTVLRLLG
jgi:formate dehydrogenase major subunit